VEREAREDENPLHFGYDTQLQLEGFRHKLMMTPLVEDQIALLQVQVYHQEAINQKYSAHVRAMKAAHRKQIRNLEEKLASMSRKNADVGVEPMSPNSPNSPLLSPLMSPSSPRSPKIGPTGGMNQLISPRGVGVRRKAGNNNFVTSPLSPGTS